MNKKEQRRLMVLNKMKRREIRIAEAAQLLSLSVRHVTRLRAGYCQGGAEALAHGNRGRKPVHAVGDGIRHKIVNLAQGMVLAGDLGTGNSQPSFVTLQAIYRV